MRQEHKVDMEYTERKVEDREDFEIKDFGHDSSLSSYIDGKLIGPHHGIVTYTPGLSYSVPEEFNDYLKVMEMGANKHGADNWLEPNGSKSSFKQMHDSMFHHLAESFAAGLELEGSFKIKLREDSESGLDPLLHVICRAQMMYTRLKRGIKHKDD